MNRITKRKEIKRINKTKIATIAIVIAIMACICVLIFVNRNNPKQSISPEMKRMLSYERVNENDNVIDGTPFVKFDAFFLKDLNDDGIADGIRGTCNKIGEEDTLYFEISTEGDGYLKDGKITINSTNFYLYTTIVRDEFVLQNYIGENTELIELNNILNGNQLLLSGKVRSGNYSNKFSIFDALDNNSTYYNQENYVTFTGTYVDSEGNETEIVKNVFFNVDWFNTPVSKIPTTYKKDEKNKYQGYDSRLTKTNDTDPITLGFHVAIQETKWAQNLATAHIEGTIPKLNGYSPISVEITDSLDDGNVTYTYDAFTGDFVAERNAELNRAGKITKQVYTGTYYTERYNDFIFSVKYPPEAYNEYMTLNIPVSGYYWAYNSGTDGFTNPVMSNVSTETLEIVYSHLTGEGTDVGVYVGTREFFPFGGAYVVSKAIPEQIYNNIVSADDLTEDDTYIVDWYINKGAEGIITNIKLKEPTEADTDEETMDDLSSDQLFKDDDISNLSLENYVTNKGIYFTGSGTFFGENGYINVYDDDTSTLIHKFTADDWDNYTKEAPYLYTRPIEHIRIETSEVRTRGQFHAISIKQINDKFLTENITREMFDEYTKISSNVSTYFKYDENEAYRLISNRSNTALYVSNLSVAEITIDPLAIGTNDTYNEKVRITTYSRNNYEQKWQNGSFLLKFPSEINNIDINSIVADNGVNILGYDAYQKNNIWFIKILTENEIPTAFHIDVDIDLTPDFNMSIPSSSRYIELYASNELAETYYRPIIDEYDVDEDSDLVEKVNYYSKELIFTPPNNISSFQEAKVSENLTIAPRIAKTDKNTRTATVDIVLKNNYREVISNILIQGVIPFEGNKYVTNDNLLGSSYSTTMTSSGISVPEELKNITFVYYSTNEHPTKDLTDPSNGWISKDDVTDWSQIKTFLIDLGDYEVQSSNSDRLVFSYNIEIPTGIEYNEIAYSEHAVYFSIDTNAGKYNRTIMSSKLGFMIAKQYDFEIQKYQKGSNKVIPGVTFSIIDTETGENKIKSTDSEGKLLVTGLYAEKEYIIKEIRTKNTYVLDDTEIHMYTYTDEDDNLYVVYKEGENNYSNLVEKYPNLLRSATVTKTDETDYVVNLGINNEVKARLKIYKTSGESLLKNVEFSLNGKGKDNITLTTNQLGQIDTSGLYTNENYVLKETTSKGYYLNNDTITFKIVNNNGFSLQVSGNNSNSYNVALVTGDDGIPVFEVRLENEKIPTYSLLINKYQKDSENKLENAYFRIYGDGISKNGSLYITDENGQIRIDDLYEYVSGKSTGENDSIYTLEEVYPPIGYTLNTEQIKFRAKRNGSGNLELEIISGEGSVRKVSDELDISVENPSSENPLCKIGIENSPNFVIHKKNDEGDPVEDATFKIYSIDENDGSVSIAKTADGQEAIGTTDENGDLLLGLGEGLYQAVEESAPDIYDLSQDEKDRTYNFGIGKSQEEVTKYDVEWVNYESSSGWNSIYDTYPTKDGGVLAVGSMYGTVDIKDKSGNVSKDLNNNNVQTITSRGEKDAIIIKSASDGTIEWVKTFGGSLDEEYKKVIELENGNIAVVGNYLSADTNLGVASPGSQDGIVVLYSRSGEYISSTVISGASGNEYMYSLTENGSKIIVTGGFYSSQISFNNGAASLNNLSTNRMNGFIASYSIDLSSLNYAKLIGTANGETMPLDIKKQGTENVVALTYVGRNIYLNSDQTISVTSDNLNRTDCLLVWYNNESGNYSSHTKVQTKGEVANGFGTNEKIKGISNLSDGSILVYGQFGADLDVDSDGTVDFSHTSGLDIFLLKYSSDKTCIKDESYVFGNTSSDELIGKAVQTADKGYLVVGWYYAKNIDVDKDGTVDINEKDGDTDGFIIKFDSNFNLIKAFKITSSGNGESYEKYDEVTSVSELNDGGFVVSGISMGLKLTFESASNPTINLAENDDGYLVKYNNIIEKPQVNALEELTVINNLKQFEITTQNITENNVGGTITGDYDSNHRPQDNIKLVENVKINRDATNDIVITPDEGYQIVSIKINDAGYIFTPDEVTGVVTIPAFENLTENKYITVLFSQNASSVEVNHLLWNEDLVSSTEKIVESEYLRGEIGTDRYKAFPRNDIQYELIKNSDYYSGKTEDDVLTIYGKDNIEEIGYSTFNEFLADVYIPVNASGTFTQDKQIVNYYYKVKPFTITTKYLIQGTDENVTDTSNSQIEDVVISVMPNEIYTTTAASNVNTMYELVETPANYTGEATEDLIIYYYYRLKNGAKVIVNSYKLGTTEEVAESLTLPITGSVKFGDTYSPTNLDDTYTENVPENYRIATNKEVSDEYGTNYGDSVPIGKNPGDDDPYIPSNYTGTYSDSVQYVKYYYVLVTPTITNSVTKVANKTVIEDSDENKSVTYAITYNATVTNYIGDLTIEITDVLDQSIDTTKSRFDGGTYDEETKTIRWTDAIEVDTYNNPESGNISITKNIRVEYINVPVTVTEIENNVTAKATLIETLDESQEVTASAAVRVEHTSTLTVTKVWEDTGHTSLRPSEVKVNIKAVVKQVDLTEVDVTDSVFNSENSNEAEKQVTLKNTTGNTNGENWTYVWSNLPKYTSDGDRITYSLEEVPLDGTAGIVYRNPVVAKTSGNDENDITYEITNTYTTPTDIINVNVTKVWDDNSNANGKRPENIKLNVKVSGESNIIQEYTLSNQTAVTHEESHIFELLKYDANGNAINYVIDEAEATSGDLKFYIKSSESGTTVNSGTADSFNASITNTFTVPDDKVTIGVTKIWSDNNNEASKRPSGIKVTVTGGATNSEFNLTTENKESLETPYVWKKSLGEFAKYDSSGNEITYIVDEEEVNTDDLKFYSKQISPSRTGDSYEYTITNTFTVPEDKLNISAKKLWIESNETQRAKRPASVILKLVKVIDEENVIELARREVNSESGENGWEVDSFGEFAKYDSLGDLVVYRIDEEEVSAGDLKFYTKSGGNVVEVSSKNLGVVTNTFTVPDEKTTYKAIKVWDDGNIDRLESIKLVVSGGENTKNYNLTASNVDSTNSNNWEYTFTNLPKYDSNGDEITYSVSEEAVNSGELDKYISSTSGNTITNKLIIRNLSIEKEATEEILSKDTKISYKLDYEADIISEYNGEVNIQIVDTLPYRIIDTTDLAGGTYTEEGTNYKITWTGTYNPTSNIITWSGGTSEELDSQEIEGINKIKFSKTISVLYEESKLIENYETAKTNSTDAIITNNVEASISLINNVTQKATSSAETEINFSRNIEVVKEWKGDQSLLASRPTSINAKLKDGDTVLDTQELNSSNTFKYTWENKSKYDTLGNEINYLVDEETVPSGYYKEITLVRTEGNNLFYKITNNKYGSIKITKVDGANTETKLPGAELNLQKLKEDENNPGSYIVDDSFNERTVTTSQETETLGVALFENLEYGKYRLRETKAPAGYNLLRSTVDIEITDVNPDYESNLSNNLKTVLPPTGEIGQYIFVIAGILIIIYAIKMKNGRVNVFLGLRPLRRNMFTGKQNKKTSYRPKRKDFLTRELEKSVYYNYQIEHDAYIKDQINKIKTRRNYRKNKNKKE